MLCTYCYQSRLDTRWPDPVKIREILTYALFVPGCLLRPILSQHWRAVRHYQPLSLNSNSMYKIGSPYEYNRNERREIQSQRNGLNAYKRRHLGLGRGIPISDAASDGSAAAAALPR